MLFASGFAGLIFGGGIAIFRHFEVRAQDALARGEDVMARWRVDAGTWAMFVALNQQLEQQPGALPNELSIRDNIPSDGIDVIVGKAAVQVDESIHALPRRSLPETTHAARHISREGLTYIEFQLYYPGGTTPSSTYPPRWTVLRFPVAAAALSEAQQVVDYYERGRPGEADFFHGTGDGTNPEDKSQCYACGFETHKFVSRCPRCGAGLQSKRWSRRFGCAMFFCGLLITGIMGPVLFYMVPLMLRPGVEINGTRFSGTPAQAMLFLGILGLVSALGVTAMIYGPWQFFTGRRDKRVVYFVVVVAIVLWITAIFMR